MRLLVLGGSGLVGQAVVEQALNLSTETQQSAVIKKAKSGAILSEVIAPTRRPLKSMAGVINPLIDYQQLDAQADYWQSDVTICCLGTTKKTAGSVADFVRIDHDYVIEAAQLAKQAGCRTFVYNSSLGANASSTSLYLKTKGIVEENLKRIGFDHLVIVRPGLLDNQGRQESRPMETLSVGLFRSLGGFLPRRFRLVEPEKLASVMLIQATSSSERLTTIESQNI